MKQKGVLLAAVMAGLLLLIFLSTVPWDGAGKRWDTVTIASGGHGGTYLPLGQQFASILESLPNTPILRAEGKVTDGAVGNFNHLFGKSADIGFVMSPAIAEGASQKKDLRLLARLYSDVLQIVVRKESGITDLEGLRKKRVYIGQDHSGTRLVARRVLEAVGLTAGDIQPSTAANFTGAVELLGKGELDAAFVVAGTPTRAVQRALISAEGKEDCRLLSLKSLLDGPGRAAFFKSRCSGPSSTLSGRAGRPGGRKRAKERKWNSGMPVRHLINGSVSTAKRGTTPIAPHAGTAPARRQGTD